MSLSTLSSKILPLARRAVITHAVRPMSIVTKSGEDYKTGIISKKSGEEYNQLNYTERMDKTSRPMSPHVFIYAFPVGAISSITNRVTGCMLSFGAAGLGALEILGGSGTALSLMQTLGSYGFIVGFTSKLAVAYPVVYHYGGALRHFAWDYYPEYLTNVDVEKASWALLGGSGVISLGFALI